MNILTTLLDDKNILGKDKVSNLEIYYHRKTHKVMVKDNQVLDEIDFLKNNIDKIQDVAEYKIVGGVARKNVYVDNLTIVIQTQAKKRTLDIFKEKFGCTNIPNFKLTRIANVDGYSFLEVFIFATKKEYIPCVLKYTGGNKFYELIKERSYELGINLGNKTYKDEKEIFNDLRINYVEPEMRECITNLDVNYNKLAISYDRKFSGDVGVNFNDLSYLYDLKMNGYKYAGVVIDANQNYLKFLNLMQSGYKGLNIYKGLKVNCLSSVKDYSIDGFDYIYGAFSMSKDSEMTFLKITKEIKKPIIIYDLGIKLDLPLQVVEMQANWKSVFSIMIENNIALAIRCNNIKDSIHPSLLYMFKSMGGQVVPTEFYNCGTNEAITYLRKGIIGNKELIDNEERFKLFLEGK